MQFPQSDQGVYLDTAATALKPQCVIDAITDFYTNSYATVHRALYSSSISATEKFQQAREKVQHFLHAEYPEEIIFTKGTTEAINLVSRCFPFKKGDSVLISEMEHHANIVPWQLIPGITLKVIPITDQGEIDLDAFRALLKEKPALISLCHISNALGTLNPVKEMTRLAHASGAKVLIDGAQAAPHMPVDVQEIDADFYAFSGHKTYGPTGIGILYGKKALLEAMPPFLGGGDMIETVTFEKTTYNTLPLKFEAGTPHIAGAIGLGAAIDFLNQIGMDKVYSHGQHLLEIATSKLQEIPGLQLIETAPDKGPIITFTIEGVHPLDIGTLLSLKGIAIRTGHHCAQPVLKRFSLPATCRISFGLYNTEKEIDLFITALKEVLITLRKPCGSI